MALEAKPEPLAFGSASPESRVSRASVVKNNISVYFGELRELILFLGTPRARSTFTKVDLAFEVKVELNEWLRMLER